MPLLPIEFLPDAIAEAREARQWYAQRSESAAERFMDELDVAIEAIQRSPERMAAYLHGTQRYLLKRFPYVIDFRVTGELIQVIAVAHGRQRPGYWQRRAK